MKYKQFQKNLYTLEKQYLFYRKWYFYYLRKKIAVEKQIDNYIWDKWSSLSKEDREFYFLRASKYKSYITPLSCFIFENLSKQDGGFLNSLKLEKNKLDNLTSLLYRKQFGVFDKFKPGLKNYYQCKLKATVTHQLFPNSCWPAMNKNLKQ